MSRSSFTARSLLGFDPAAVQVLRLLVTQADADEPTIAQTLGLTTLELRAALATLERDQLAVRVDVAEDRWAALPPRAALSTLLARRRTELASWEQHVDELEADYVAALGRRAQAHYFETVLEPEQVGAVYAQLLESATTEVLHLVKPPYVESSGRPAGSGADVPLHPGLALRSVYERSGFPDDVALHTVARGTAKGGQLRLLDDLPFKLAVFDRRTALLPLRPHEPIAGSLVVHAPVVVLALVELFESLWLRAAPLAMADAQAQDGERIVLTDRTRDVLKLMAAGLTDDAIGRALGVSRRTVQKHISDLAEALGARTRFQIALLAAERGLISTGSTASVVEPV